MMKVKPTLKDIELSIKKLTSNFPKIVQSEVIGYSVEKRPIWMVKITDFSIPDDNKSNVLIVGGHHGSEESGRASCLGLLEWLVTKEAEKVRKNQIVLVIPCINVDGAYYNTPNNANGVNLCRDYSIKDGPTQPETKCVLEIAEKYQPDVVVDVHGLGGGSVHEMVMITPTREYTEDDWIFNLLAFEMRKSAEKKGYPQAGHSLSWHGWFDDDKKGNIIHLVPYCYKKFHSIGLLTESNEATFTLREMKESGSARLISLLKMGVKRYPWEYYSGYPNRILSGSFFLSIVSYGKTEEQRRKSIPDILNNMDYFNIGRVYPEKRGIIKVNLEYKGKELKKGIGVRVRVKDFIKVKGVSINDKVMEYSEENGYIKWCDSCSTFVQFNMPVLLSGRYSLKIKYKI